MRELSLDSYISQLGFMNLSLGHVVMWLIGLTLIYLAIHKKYEPLLLLPIGFGVFIVNLPLTPLMGEHDGVPDLIRVFFHYGIEWDVIPPLIFLGIGALTDFGPLIANPKLILLGAAAQLGVYAAFFGALGLGFNLDEAASIGIIGGADGPTSIFLTAALAPHLLGPIAVSAYSYMSLVPVIQPPIMRMLTSQKERQIQMKQLRAVSRLEKLLFPLTASLVILLLVPKAAPLVAMFMIGNLFRESKVVDRLNNAAQNELLNITTIFLGISVGATMSAENFLQARALLIFFLGLVAFGFSTFGGVVFAKFMNLFLKEKINPLIGSAGVSAVPMAARVSQTVGMQANPRNHLLMHAMGPNVGGVIGTLVAAGTFLAFLL
ncbi:MAG: glutaconyl-CoA decarboxylase subunit beta [Acidobacteria bacterium RIFCSPLOWO2_02_FULL_59_13]|nr:MAG: glutaconyl-CoA decarboxylase subunit beta [Acidobacteria bacterium RIFCSPLOWO2_02_FULL_59_13]